MSYQFVHKSECKKQSGTTAHFIIKFIYKIRQHFLINSMDSRTRKNCNSMPFGAAWAYYGKVLVQVGNG